MRGSYYDEGEIARLLERFGRCPIDGGCLAWERNAMWRPVLVCGLGHHLGLEHYVAVALGCHLEEAMAWMRDFLGRPDLVAPETPCAMEALTLRAIEDPAELAPGNAYWSTERGIPAEVQAAFGMGTIGGKPGLNYLDHEGRLVAQGLRNPEVEENTTVTKLDGRKWDAGRSARQVLFGEAQALAMGRDFLVLVEGAVDAVRFWQAGIPAVATSSPTPSIAQGIRACALAAQVKTIILCPDQDEAGKAQATAKATTCFLRPFFALETLTLPVKDAGLMTPEALRAAFEAAFQGRFPCSA